MNLKRFVCRSIPLLATVLLASCGSGHGNSEDIFPSKPVAASFTGPNSFLLFPNPQIQPDGSLQIAGPAYSQAYYAAIDPTNAKDTLAKWKAANGFGTPTGPLGEVSAVYGDWRDLGYGRRITVRQNADRTIAVAADNYIFNVGGDYGSNSAMNLAAAIAQDPMWFIGTTAIEFSPAPGVTPGPNCTGCFAKFYFFAPSGARLLTVDLDGRGQKSTIEVCSSCHGGRGDPLTPATGSPTGQPLFPLAQNSASLSRGDIEVHPHPIEVDTLDFPGTAGITRADQEPALKTMNRILLCTFPIPVASAFPEDACRRTATPNEWQGGADTIIKDAYGGNGLPSATYGSVSVPAAWATAGQSTLYQNVVAPTCRVCHILRGVGAVGGDDVDFDTYAVFNGYADRIKAHMIDRGTMPLSKILYERFWATPAMSDTLATYLQGAGYTARDASGAVLRPGRPVADPGPDRTVPQGATVLSGANSLFASTFAWSIVSGPAGGATLTNANSAQATFTATINGTYMVQLITGNGATQSVPAPLTLVVNSALSPAPSAIRFANIKTVLQGTCLACHTTGSATLATAAQTPIVYTNVDRNGDGIVDSGTINSIDDLWLYTEVRGRINFADITSSPLLRKPSGNHHNGLLQNGFDTTKPPGDPARINYDLFLNWILNGAPQ